AVDLDRPVPGLEILLNEQVTPDADRAVVGPERAAFEVPADIGVPVEPRLARDRQPTVDIDIRVAFDPQIPIEGPESDLAPARNACLCHRPGKGLPPSIGVGHAR